MIIKRALIFTSKDGAFIRHDTIDKALKYNNLIINEVYKGRRVDSFRYKEVANYF